MVSIQVEHQIPMFKFLFHVKFGTSQEKEQIL